MLDLPAEERPGLKHLGLGSTVLQRVQFPHISSMCVIPALLQAEEDRRSSGVSLPQANNVTALQGTIVSQYNKQLQGPSLGQILNNSATRYHDTQSLSFGMISIEVCA